MKVPVSLFSSMMLAHGIILPTFRVGLPHSVNPLEPPSDTPTGIALVLSSFLSPIKLEVKVSHHSGAFRKGFYEADVWLSLIVKYKEMLTKETTSGHSR